MTSNGFQERREGHPVRYISESVRQTWNTAKPSKEIYDFDKGYTVFKNSIKSSQF